MSEFETAISVVGTLIGTLSGLLIGIWIESKREKHETSAEYRRELLKHMDDVIKPLYHLVQEQWGSLAVLETSVRFKSSIIKGKTIDNLASEVQEALLDLKAFCLANNTKMDLLFPHPLSSWVFVPISEKIEGILAQISSGKEPFNEITEVINALMKYQKDLKRLVGYETEQKLENIYPFT